MKFKSTLAGLCLALLAASGALAVSVGELIGKCGDDAKQHCKGVGYGNAMQVCLGDNYKQLTPQCKAIMDRLDGGEKVTLF